MERDGIEYLEEETIITINKYLTTQYGQNQFVQQPANLTNLLLGVKRYANGSKNFEKRIFAKAAYLFYHLANDSHVFLDGNKRTAVFSLWFFLFLNNYYLKLTFEDTLHMALDTAKAEKPKSISQVIKWIRKNAKKIDWSKTYDSLVRMLPPFEQAGVRLADMMTRVAKAFEPWSKLFNKDS